MISIPGAVTLGTPASGGGSSVAVDDITDAGTTGKKILKSETAADAQSAMGLGSAATKNTGKNPEEIALNGDFGVGGFTVALPTTGALNALKASYSGLYAVDSGSDDMPSRNAAYQLSWMPTSSAGGGHGVLVAIAVVNKGSALAGMYRNALRGGVWQGWVRLWDADNTTVDENGFIKIKQ